MKFEYAIIVKNKTRLETLVERYNTRAQARFYIESLGGSFEDYEVEHENFHAALVQVQTSLSRQIKNKTVDRQYLPSYIFSASNLIIVLGQDGLVANTAKYSNGCPMIAVNPDVTRYDGVLLPFTIADFMLGVEQVMQGKATLKTARLAEAQLNNGQRLLAFNDLFIGAASHVSARYTIEYKGKTEDQSSSGFIVSTAAGATGWLSSVFNM
ncbi:MAG: sugar kinase, partial [Sphingobacteriales bacterium]